MLTRRTRRDADARLDPLREAQRVNLLIAGGDWPVWRADGAIAYRPELRRLIDADLVWACAWCGRACATATPLPDDGRSYSELTRLEQLARLGWGTCGPCHAGIGRHDARWPLAAALDRGGVHDSDPVFAAILASRPVNVPGYAAVGSHAKPDRPVAPWSHLLDLPCGAAHHYMWPDGTGGYVRANELERFPSWARVVATEIGLARRNLARSELVPPPVGEACWWCGVGQSPRAAWEDRGDDRVWCGMAEQCPPPTGNDLLDRVAAIGQVLGDPVDAQQTLRLQATSGAFRWWGEHDDDTRPAPASEPYSWLSEAVREAWIEYYDDATLAVVDRMAGRDAERAQADSLARLAEAVARNTATEAVADAGERIAKSVTKAVQRDQRRRASSQPGPVITHRNAEAIERRRAGQNRR